MSLGIAFKGPEGVVLAADSRVTLTGTLPDGTKVPSSFDNATKLLEIRGHGYVGVVTFGQGAIGTGQGQRTAHSYLPELEQRLAGRARLSIEEFAREVGDFFLAQWIAASMPADADPMCFLFGGYDAGETYGRVYQVVVPAAPIPSEQNPNEFGLTFGGQTEVTNRLLAGYDPQALEIARTTLGLSDGQVQGLAQALRALQLSIPMPFLPLQDCVDLAIFIIQTTATLQTWIVGVRGVGGAIDVATITRTEGFRALQRKQVSGSKIHQR
jgi:hypothetical protein